ncbi:hypothetical protein Hdeb2414_s0004g00150741 [Helianthus debilis subsp. tardiflorus]
MGGMKLILFLLVLLNFISPLSFAHVANNYSGREDDGVVNQSKFAHASARGGSGDGGCCEQYKPKPAQRRERAHNPSGGQEKHTYQESSIQIEGLDHDTSASCYNRM